GEPRLRRDHPWLAWIVHLGQDTARKLSLHDHDDRPDGAVCSRTGRRARRSTLRRPETTGARESPGYRRADFSVPSRTGLATETFHRPFLRFARSPSLY